MSKPDQNAVNHQPPHSLTLRAKQRSMPNTPGVHVLAAEISPRLAQISAAIDRVALDDESAWTKAKGPRVSALEAVLGYQITEAERDAAWALNQEN